MSPETFDEVCINLRKKLKSDADLISRLKAVVVEGGYEGGDKGEKIANLTLAYRHMEDATMRVGKAIQAFEGGVSIYDKDRPNQVTDKPQSLRGPNVDMEEDKSETLNSEETEEGEVSRDHEGRPQVGKPS